MSKVTEIEKAELLNAVISTKMHDAMRRLLMEHDVLIEQSEKAQQVNKCPDCGGSGKVEMSSDPYYAERCICTYDPAQLIIEIEGLRNELKQVQAENEQLKSDKQKLVESLERIEGCTMSMFSTSENMSIYMISLAQQALSEVKGNVGNS